MIETISGGTMITGDSIQLFQHIARRDALRMEMFGLKRRGQSVASIIKQVYGLKARTNEKLLQLFEDWLDNNGVPLTRRYSERSK